MPGATETFQDRRRLRTSAVTRRPSRQTWTFRAWSQRPPVAVGLQLQPLLGHGLLADPVVGLRAIT
jgi:hypothetical protein